MASKCKICSRSVTTKLKGVSCAVCSEVSHQSCGKISDELIKEIESGTSDWRCVNCRKVGKRKSLINLGVERTRNDSIASNSGDDCSNNGPPNNLSVTINSMAANVKKLAASQQEYANSLAEINQQMEALQALSSTVEKHDKRLKSLEADNKCLKTMVSEQQTLIRAQTLRLDNFEQRNHRNKLQISHVPLSTEENLSEIVINIMNKMNISISTSDLLDIYRMRSTVNAPNTIQQSEAPTRESAGYSGSSTSTNRNNSDKRRRVMDNPIVITFRSTSLRDTVLKNYRSIKDRKLFFDDNEEIRIFVNESLTSSRKRLLYKTKLFGKENGHKYIWTKNGQILLKKDNNSKVIFINSATDFATLDRGEQVDSE